MVKNLGVLFESTLSMNTHVNKICSTAFNYLYDLGTIRTYLSRESTETVIREFVLSHVHYCKSIFLWPASLSVRQGNLVFIN